MSSFLDVGEVAALCTAVSWTVSSVAFAESSRRAGVSAINQFRLCLALPVMFAMAAFSMGGWWPQELPTNRLLALLVSGVVGFVLGDAFYFHALKSLGPRLASVLYASWPAMATGLGAWWSGEAVGWLVGGGVLLTLGGIVLVLLRSGDASWNPSATRRQHVLGVLAAFVGAFGQAAGVALSRPAMLAGPDLPEGLAPVVATMLRLLAAVPATLVLALWCREPLVGLRVLRDRRTLWVAVVGTTFGPIFGVLLSMVALRHAAHTGVASALMASTPLWMMAVAAVFYRGRIGWLGGLGTVLAVAGAGLLMAAG